MPDHHLSPHLHEKYTNDLLATMRRIEQLEAEKKECTAFIGDVVKTEDARTRMLRDLLEGKVAEQVALPGLDEPVTRQREIGARLRMAVEKVELICNVDKEVQDFAEDRRPLSRAGALAVAAGVPASRAMKQEALEKLVGTREDAIAAHEAKSLAWKKEGENLVAYAKGGTYCVEPGLKGGFTLLWTPAGKPSKRVAVDLPYATAAKDLAQKHQLERQADGMLANAGAGELTKKDLKGDAVARKKGGRRG